MNNSQNPATKSWKEEDGHIKKYSSRGEKNEVSALNLKRRNVYLEAKHKFTDSYKKEKMSASFKNPQAIQPYKI